MTLEERMNEAWETSDRIKQADLINQTFTIHAATLTEFDSKQNPGVKDVAYVASISFEGQEEHHDAWIGGRVMAQVKVLIEENALPATVKQIKDGQAYKLLLIRTSTPVAIAGVPGTSTATATTPAVTQGGKSVQALAIEMLDAARTKLTDAEIEALVSEHAVDAMMYDEDGTVLLNHSTLTTKDALALKNALAE